MLTLSSEVEDEQLNELMVDEKSIHPKNGSHLKKTSFVIFYREFQEY